MQKLLKKIIKELEKTRLYDRKKLKFAGHMYYSQYHEFFRLIFKDLKDFEKFLRINSKKGYITNVENDRNGTD